MKVRNFKRVNTETIHVFSTWHSVPNGYDETLDVWREFIVDDCDLYADEESREEWKKDLRAHVEAVAKKEFPWEMWESIKSWYYVIYHDEAYKVEI